MAGVASVFHSLGFLFRTPRVWPASLVPAAILFALTAVLVWLSFSYIRPLIGSWLPETTEWYWQLGAGVVTWLGTILACLLGLLVALAVTPPLSAPALEHIVAARERELGVPERSPIGFFAEMWCGFKAQLFAALFALPLLVLLGIIDFVFPIAAVLTVPLKCIVVSLSLAWNLFDYPLTLRGVKMRDRFTVLNTHWKPALGFGLAFTALFWIPCFSVLLLPMGVIGATQLLWWILLHDPEVAPTISRPALEQPPA